MKKYNKQLKSKLGIRQIMLVAALVGGLVMSTKAVKDFILPVPKADKQVPVEALNLTPPYLRLSEIDNPNPKQISTEVRANTGGLETTAVDIVIEYESAILNINESGVKLYGKYAVSNFVKIGDGLISLSFFSSPDRGEPTLRTANNTEEIITTFIFDVVDENASSTTLNFVFEPGKLDETNLIKIFTVRPEQPEDILKEVQGLTISL